MFDKIKIYLPDGVESDLEENSEKLNAIIKQAKARFEDFSGVNYDDDNQRHFALLVPLINVVISDIYTITDEKRKSIYYQFDLIRPKLQALKFEGAF